MFNNTNWIKVFGLFILGSVFVHHFDIKGVEMFFMWLGIWFSVDIKNKDE